MESRRYRLTDKQGVQSYVSVTVEPQEDHFVSSSIPVDNVGNILDQVPALAPKFYGVTKEQALRRMTDALENSYDEVELLGN